MTRTINSICFGCAALYGGVARAPSAVTVWEGICDNCGDVTGLTDVRDWLWPRGKPATWEGSGTDGGAV